MSESATPETHPFQLPIVLLAEVSLKKLLYAFSMVVYVTRVGLRNNFFANIHFFQVLFCRVRRQLIKRQLISGDKSYQATTHINLKKRQLISGDNSYQATTHINLKKRQLISSNNLYQSKLISEN